MHHLRLFLEFLVFLHELLVLIPRFVDALIHVSLFLLDLFDLLNVLIYYSK